MAGNIEPVYQRYLGVLDLLRDMQRVFVVGCAKSGTTWLMNLLAGHPQVAIAGEGGFAWQLAPAFFSACRSFNKHQQQHRQPDLTCLRDIDQLLTLRAMIDWQLARYIEASGKRMDTLRCVGDKTPQHTTRLPLLHQLYPGAKFIHVIRDPRDVATSAWFHLGQRDQRSFEEYIQYFITEVWPLNVTVAREAGEKLPGQYLEIHYEKLLQEEEQQILALLKMIDVDSSPEMVRACSDSGDFTRRSGGRARGETRTGHFYRNGKAGDWRNHLPPPLAQQACTAIADTMRMFGYDPDCSATPDEAELPAL